jgi:hypothetical protein
MKTAFVFVILLAFGQGISPHERNAREHQQISAPAKNTASASFYPSTIINPILPFDLNSGKEQQSAHDKHRNLHPEWFWPPIWSNWILAMVAICGIRVALGTLKSLQTQTHFIKKQAIATKKSVALAEFVAKKQLRAYMVVRNARLFFHEDGAVEAKMELANCGQTPAYDVRGAHFPRFSLYPIKEPGVPPSELRQSQSVIGAGLALHILSHIGRHDKGDREYLLAKLSEKGQDLVYSINGYFTYRDIFKDSHFLKFQLIVGGPSGVWIDRDSSGMWASFNNDSEGNDAD